MKIILIILINLKIYAIPAWAATTDGQEDICASPAVIMCENFEDRAIGNSDLARTKFKNQGWAVSRFDTNGPRVITDSAAGVFSGSRALKLTYPAGNNTGGGFLDSKITMPGTTTYIRFYTKYSSNFQWSYIANKHMEMVTSDGQTTLFQFWLPGGGGTGSKATFFYNYFTQQRDAWIPSPNMNGDAMIIPDKWQCLEARYTMNSTATSSDGYLQGWVDNKQHWEYPNVNLNNKPGGQGPLQGMLISSYWNCYSGGSGSESCTDTPRCSSLDVSMA